MSDKQGLVYVLEAEGSGCIKLGYTTNLVHRLRALQANCPFKLVVIKTYEGTQNNEKALHWMWRSYRVNNEWYRLNPLVRRLPLDFPDTGDALTKDEVVAFLDRAFLQSKTIAPQSKEVIVNVRVTPEDKADLKRFADSLNLNLSDAIRELIRRKARNLSGG